MKKFIILCFLICLGYVYLQDKRTINAVEYVTAEESSERTAENIIRDTLGTLTNWANDDKKGRVISIQSIPQVQTGKLALDFRVRLDDSFSENTLVYTLLRRGGKECLRSLLLNDDFITS